MEPISVLLIEPDSSSAAFIRHMLTRAGYEVHYAPSGKEGLIAAWRDQPDAIVLELDLPDIAGLEVVRKLRGDSRTKSKKILTLTERSGAEETQRAMEAGVDHYIVKQTDAVELLLRTLADEAFPESESDGRRRPIKPGRVISFISAKGGVGTSSLSANVTHSIGEGEDHDPVLIDLVLPLGSLANYVGAGSHPDIVHLTTQLKPGELNNEYFRANLGQPRSWAFQFIPGAKDPAAGAELEADRLAPIIQSLRASYDWLVVDLGRTLSRISLLILRQSDVIVMVFSPEPAIVSNTSAVLRYLTELNIPSDRIFLLANRPLGTEEMDADEVEAALNREIDILIPHMGSNQTLANRLNVPLDLRFPEDGGTVQVAKAASLILQRQAEKADSLPA